MCTVSFIRADDSIIITSNRDEHMARPTAYKPREEYINGIKVLYPKDPIAGGSWFAVNDRHVVSVLLNGAFTRHQSKGDYAKSRGLVLLDVISNARPIDKLTKMNLDRIEPFTIVLFEEYQLFEFRWDSTQRHLKELSTNSSFIWSSTTLYSKEVIDARERLFRDFMDREDPINSHSVLNFHSNDHNDQDNGFIIDRESGLKTFSITQAIIGEEQATLRHIDLQSKEDHTLAINSRHSMGQL